MPLGLGLASSHAPSMFVTPEQWPPLHEILTNGIPQPPQIQEETSAVIESYVQRIRKNFRVLREQLEAYRPDAVIIVGDDQMEVFSRAFIPALAIYLGEQVDGQGRDEGSGKHLHLVVAHDDHRIRTIGLQLLS